jgi:hypothetical protein
MSNNKSNLYSYVLPNHLFSCWVKWYNVLPGGGTDAGWKPGESKIGEKSSLLSDDSCAASSSEDDSAVTGCRDVMCMRRAYANSPQMGLASVIHPFKFLLSTGGGGCQVQVVSSDLV